MTDRALPSEGWPPAVLDPAGPYSEPVTVLAWVLLLGGTLILAIVLGALWIALRGSPRLKTRLGGERRSGFWDLPFPRSCSRVCSCGA